MFDDLYQVLQQHLPLLVGDDSCCDVAEDVRAASLNCVQVAIQETDNNLIHSTQI